MPLPTGLLPAAQSTSSSSSTGGFGGFFDSLLEVGSAFGTSLLQLELFDRTLDARERAAATTGVNGGINGPAIAADAAAAAALAQQNSGFGAIFSDPQTLLFIGAGVLVLLLMFFALKRAK